MQKKRGIPHSTVQFIYSAEREADNCRKKASATVPEPKKNEIGSSDDFPYFFSLANSEKGDSHLTDDAILLSSFFRTLFSSPVYYIHFLTPMNLFSFSVFVFRYFFKSKIDGGYISHFNTNLLTIFSTIFLFFQHEIIFNI